MRKYLEISQIPPLLLRLVGSQESQGDKVSVETLPKLREMSLRQGILELKKAWKETFWEGRSFTAS